MDIPKRETTRQGYWGRLLVTTVWEDLPGWTAIGGNSNAMKLQCGNAWCWLVLYREQPAVGSHKLAALIRLSTQMGQAAWEAMRAQAAAGTSLLPEGARFSHKTNGLIRWNIVIERDLPRDGSLDEMAQYAWLSLRARELTDVVERHILPGRG